MLKTLLIVLLVLISSPVSAYVGPGAGISVLGSLLGILATIFVAIGAILFWPIRKLMRRKKKRTESGPSQDTDSSSADY